MRCLSLAEELQRRGNSISFISRDLPGNSSSLINRKGYGLYLLSTHPFVPVQDSLTYLQDKWRDDADECIALLREMPFINDWLIIDHYALDIKWELQLRPWVSKIMVIDDLANRPHDCDSLLDQNYCIDMDSRYHNLVPEKCQQLLGSDYVLLRSEFTQKHGTVRKRGGKVKRILVFFGGSDLGGETEKVLHALYALKPNDIMIDVVVGEANPRKGRIYSLCQGLQNTNYYCQIDYMANLMEMADMAVGGGGSTVWERCCIGLPGIVVPVAENQIMPMRELAKAGAIDLLEREMEVDDYVAAISRYLDDLTFTEQMVATGRRMFDGQGAERVVSAITGGSYD